MRGTSDKNRIYDRELDIYYYGSQICNEGHYWGPAIKEHYKIHYILSGKGVFSTGDNTYYLKEGQGFLICPNEVSYYKADEVEPWTYSWIAFDGLNAGEYLNRANLSKDQPVFLYIKDNKMSQCFEEMLMIGDTDKSKDLKLKSLLYHFLALLTDVTVDKQLHVKPLITHDFYTQKVIEIINVNFSRKISIYEIACSICLDRKYLSAIFKTSLGITLQDYLIKFRMDKACKLMQNDLLSIGDISRSVGYEDPLAFSRMFKRIKGISPRQFRNNI